VSEDYSDPPTSWLFPHRWKSGGLCPRDGTKLLRAMVGGRTTAWCPQCQIADQPS
jgi:formamidopyrimidine-DNA glycosylase